MPHRKVVFCSSPFVLLDANVYQYNLLSLAAWVEGISLTFVKFCGKLQHAEKYSFDIITIHWSARGKRNIPMNGAILHSGCREERPSQAKTRVKKRNRLNPRKRNYAQQLLGHCNLKLNLPKLKPNSCKAKKDSRSCAKYHVKKKNRFLQTRYPKNRQTDTISDDEDDFEMLFKSERTDLSTADDDDERVKQGSKKYRNLYRQSCSF